MQAIGGQKGEFIVGVLVCGGLLVWLFSSRTIDRHMSRQYGVWIEGLAHQFKALNESLELSVFDKVTRYAAVI